MAFYPMKFSDALSLLRVVERTQADALDLIEFLLSEGKITKETKTELEAFIKDTYI